MVKEEMGMLLIAMKAMYPNWAKDLTTQQAEAIIVVWHDMLGEYPYELVKGAVRTMAAISPYPPSIAEIISNIQRLTQTEKTLTDVEAWRLVRNAASNSTYNSKAEFDKLPEQIRLVLRTPSALKDYALADTQSLDTVQGSQFMRSYRASVSEAKQHGAMPMDLKELVEKATNRVAIGTPRSPDDEEEVV